MQVRTPATGYAASGISVNTISGTNVVFFGIDATPTARNGLLGFAVRRIDFLETGQQGSDRWLKGRKVFKSVIPNPAPNQEFESKDHPIQSFAWSDYRAKPGYLYKYFVHPLYGSPANPQLGPAAEIAIRTEDTDDGTHAVFFNRGAIASQAFTEKFPDLADMSKVEEQQLDDPDNEATKWLSRGLLEAALDFINSTTPEEKLRVAVYEFTYRPIVLALLAAHQRGVDVKVIYEAGNKTEKGKTKPTSATNEAKKTIEEFDLPAKMLIARKNRGLIPHNKFMIKLRGGKAEEVWTGSTNITMSGFLGQGNNGHLVRDKATANAFLAYWKNLAKDPKQPEMKEWVEEKSPMPSAEPLPGTMTIFSPRENSKMLAWYASRVKAAKSSVFFTAAFGLNLDDNKLHIQVASKADTMRFLLLEKPDGKIGKLHKADPNFMAAVGAGLGLGEDRKPLPGWEMAHWFQENHFRRQGNIFFVHLKFLLIDPLGPDPLVITGSANFSPNSLLQNDENMLIIRGDKRVAHVYFTEFDRLFRHFIYRNAANADSGNTVDSQKFLDETGDWMTKHFKPGTYQDRRRVLFA